MHTSVLPGHRQFSTARTSSHSLLRSRALRTRSVMIGQGLISFKCDALDLGIRSWSHPTDRSSATILTILLTPRYVFFVRCAGPLGVTMYASLFVFLAVGLVCFNRSCIACREKNLDDYRKWHVSWHFTYPGMMVVFYLFQYLAPSDAISCSIDL